MKNLLLVLFCSVLALTACQTKEKPAAEAENKTAAKPVQKHENTASNPAISQAEIDKKLIAEYVAKNDLEVKTTASGIHYRIIKEGDVSKKPVATSKVSTNYKGQLLSGTVFDESPQGKPVSFGLNQVIPGWTEGLQLIGEGGTIQLILPSNLAYGPRKVSVIPANSVLIFDVDLLKVN